MFARITIISRITLIALALALATTIGVSAGSSGLDPGFVNDACGGVTGGAAGDCGSSVAVNSLTGNVINVISYAVGAASVIMIVVGGFRYVLSNGDPQAIGSAKNTILYSLVGLVVALAAQGIVRFVIDRV